MIGRSAVDLNSLLYLKQNYLLLHKNQQNVIENIRKTILEQCLSSISFDDAITKTYFFHKLALSSDVSTIYLDFDLLYSGYVAAQILHQNENVELLQPTSQNWKEFLVNVLDKISQEKHLVIIDSLNGFFATLTDNKEIGRIINTHIALLTSVAQKTNSSILVGSISKFKKDEGWVLSAIGRHVIEIDKMNFISVRKENSHLKFATVDNQNQEKLSLQISDLDLL
jgi:hypothetical protein